MSFSEEEGDLESWGWTDLSSYSLSALEEEQHTETVLQPPTMSRRSLRLHSPYSEESLRDCSQPYGSASFSVGGASRRDSKLLNSRRSQQHSVSCSQSMLLHTPRKQAGPPAYNSSLYSVASDASLLSSLLDESSIQERTLVDSFWGLDCEGDRKDGTIIADSSALANSTLLASGDNHCPKHPAQASMVDGSFYCKDCALHSERKEALTAYACPSAGPLPPPPPPSSRPADQGLAAKASSAPSTIYSRDKKRKAKTGVLMSIRGVTVSVARRSAAFVVYFLTLLYQHVLLKKRRNGIDVLRSWLDSWLFYGRGAAASTVSLLAMTLKACHRLTMQAALLAWNRWGKAKSDRVNRAHSRSSRSMDKDQPGADANNPHLNGSLWKALSDMLWFLGRGWYHTVTFMSLLKDFLLTRSLSKLFKLVVFLIIVLILLSLLGLWAPFDLLSALPAVNLTGWRKALPLASLPGLPSVFPLTSPWSQSTEPQMEESRVLEPPAVPPPLAQQQEEEESFASARLLRLEESLSRLWQRVERTGLRAEQRHDEVVQLYQDLRQQLHQDPPGDSMEHLVAGLIEERLAQLSLHLEEDRVHREQTQKRYLTQQQSQASRLAELESLLQTLAAKTEVVQHRHESVSSISPATTSLLAPASTGVDKDSHDALLAEVARLEADLGDIRQDLQGLTGRQDSCEQMDNLQEKVVAQVSAQVREELRSLFYGNQLATVSEASADPATLPDSLLQWLSERYVTGADLQASLAALELSILQNISVQLGQGGQEQASCSDTVRQTVVSSMTAAGAAVTEEQVQQIVRNALRLYSQDQTGLADYALESGGGSILSTRCSETFETRTALLSLFGLPLWYFSQSPRAVIQPDVHPGNCWAFKGSSGYLVIRLSMKILPTAFSLEHMPKELAPSGAIHSAPRDFIVYGLDDESQEKGKLLGNYTYEETGEALQTYHVSEENDEPYQIIEMRVLSNWGHPEYTCMYRFRVHGKPTN